MVAWEGQGQGSGWRRLPSCLPVRVGATSHPDNTTGSGRRLGTGAGGGAKNLPTGRLLWWRSWHTPAWNLNLGGDQRDSPHAAALQPELL